MCAMRTIAFFNIIFITLILDLSAVSIIHDCELDAMVTEELV